MSDTLTLRNSLNKASTPCRFCGAELCAYPSQTRIFIIENLGCANCAAQMEERIAALPGIEEASVTFATKQLRVTCAHPREMIPCFQEICSSIEPQTRLREYTRSRTPTASDIQDSSERAQAPESFVGFMSDRLCIIASAILLIAGVVCERIDAPVILTVALFVIAYLIAGGEVLWGALRNIRRGQIFDENFLMSIATIGAFAIQAFPEAVGVMLFYRIGEYFENRAIERSRAQIMDAVDMRPETVNLLPDLVFDALHDAQDNGVSAAFGAGSADVHVISASDARRGDFLLVRPGDRIPLDGRVIQGESRVDTAPVTGEPVPVRVTAGRSVISGCINGSGALVVQVENELADSMVTRILDAVEDAAANKPHIQRFITRFARVYTPIVIGIALLTALIPSLVTGDWSYWVYTALSFLVISCPCAIVLSVPLAFFAGIGAASRLGILFKGGNVIEAIRRVRVAVLDKTGTITKGDFSVQRIQVALGIRMTDDELLTLAASAEELSTHPIALSVVSAARERGLILRSPLSAEERLGKGIVAHIRTLDGTEQTVVCGNRNLLEEAGISIVDESVVVYGTEVFIGVDATFVGSLIIADTPKEDSHAAIEALRSYGIHTVMLTGDAPVSADAIAAEMGIEEVRSRLLPEQKLEELNTMRIRYGTALFVGDGINDAPVLAGADVGAAMGSGSDAAIEAADIVFMKSALSAVPQSIRIARAVGSIALQNIVFALVVKISVMVLGFVGLASLWMAIFADVGVALLCIMNSIRILYQKFV